MSLSARLWRGSARPGSVLHVQGLALHGQDGLLHRLGVPLYVQESVKGHNHPLGQAFLSDEAGWGGEGGRPSRLDVQRPLCTVKPALKRTQSPLHVCISLG